MGQKFDSFFHKLKFKYKISILNENTLEESWSLHLSRLNVILFCFGVAVVYFFLIAVLLIETPFRTFLPGYYSSESMRKQVMKEALTMDSLENQMALQQKYVALVQDIIAGNVKPDSTADLDSLTKKDYSNLDLNPSKNEKEYTDKYEKQSKEEIVDAQDYDSDRPAYTYFLHNPATGNITNHFDPAASQYGITMNLRPHSNVCAALGGTVIFSGYSTEQLYTLQIQHKDNVLTVYKCTMPFIARVGDSVRPGQAICAAPQQDACNLTFEIWESGRPINPETYMRF